MSQYMNILEDITPLSVFRTNTSDFIKKLHAKKRPVFITLNGKIEIVMQDAQSYQASIDKIAQLEDLLSIQRGLRDVELGNVSPVDQVFKKIREGNAKI